jgi:ribose transport system substrate-binding protein
VSEEGISLKKTDQSRDGGSVTSRFKSYFGVVALVVLSTLVAACGSSNKGGSSSTASASGSSTSANASAGKCGAGVLDKVNAELAKYRAAPTFKPPGPAFDASKARGKTIFNIPLTSKDPFTQIVDKYEAKAAKDAGVNFIQYSNSGAPSDWVAGMQSGISRKADLILLEGSPDPRLLKPQLAAAHKAGIKVISTHLFDQIDTPEQLAKLDNVDALVGSPHALGGGTLSALYAIAYTKCDLNAAMLAATDVQPSYSQMIDAYKAELNKYCPQTCKFSVISQPYGKWATDATGAIASKLNSDPSINIVAPQYDYGATFAKAAVASTGHTGKTHVISYNGAAADLQLIANGDKIYIADVGEPLPWIGYANVDQALRLLAGVKPIRDENTPVRLWDASNISEAGNPVSQTAGYGPVSAFVDGYHKLWGIGQ